MVADQAAVDEGALKRLGVRGLVRPSANALQVVSVPSRIRSPVEIRSALHGSASSAAVRPPPPVPPRRAGHDGPDAGALLAALGGTRQRARGGSCGQSAARLSVGDTALVDRAAISWLGLRGTATPNAGCVHVIVGPPPAPACAALQEVTGVGGVWPVG